MTFDIVKALEVLRRWRLDTPNPITSEAVKIVTDMAMKLADLENRLERLELRALEEDQGEE